MKIKKYLLIFLTIWVFLVFQYNYFLSKDLNNIYFTKNKYENINFNIYEKNNKEKEKDYKLIKKQNNNYLLINNYYNNCKKINNLNIIKLKNNEYGLFILNNKEINFDKDYKDNLLMSKSNCYYNIEIELPKTLNINDIIYIFDKNEVVKEVLIH